MSKHGYRFVGYGGLYHDIDKARNESRVERIRVEYATPAPALQPQQSQQQPVYVFPVMPDHVREAYEREQAHKLAVLTEAVGALTQVVSEFCAKTNATNTNVGMVPMAKNPNAPKIRFSVFNTADSDDE